MPIIRPSKCAAPRLSSCSRHRAHQLVKFCRTRSGFRDAAAAMITDDARSSTSPPVFVTKPHLATHLVGSSHRAAHPATRAVFHDQFATR